MNENLEYYWGIQEIINRKAFSLRYENSVSL